MANLDGHFTGVTDAIAAERKAMAQAQRDAEKRLFAVVMGSSLPRWCRPSDDWDEQAAEMADGKLSDAIWSNSNLL